MNILFVGLSGVPYMKRACDTRLIYFIQALTSKGNFVTILNRCSVNKKPITDFYLPPGSKCIELIKTNRRLSKFCSILMRLFSYPIEFIWIIKENRKKPIDILHLYSGHYFEFLHYYLISRIIKSKVVYQYVEARSSWNLKGYHKLNGFLCDRFGYKLFDGVISISTFISSELCKLSSELPVIQIPPICDIDYFENIKPTSEINSYILYCGSAGYGEVINLIIESYRKSKLKEKYKLILVLSGNNNDISNVTKILEKNEIVLTNLEYKDLVGYYLKAKALLIPLRNSLQDKARFPNKICEYTATKGVIITTGYGEIVNYFENRKNALIASEYTVEAFSSKLDELLLITEDDLSKIKEESFKVCKSSFDINVYSERLNDFLKTTSNLNK